MDRDEDDLDDRYYGKSIGKGRFQDKPDFQKEISCQLYGFGDAKNPYKETVELVEKLVVDYITETTQAALDIGKPNKITLEDITYVIRKDKRKATRAKELLHLNEEIKRARKGIDDALGETPK